jgi:hypothetical protein
LFVDEKVGGLVVVRWKEELGVCGEGLFVGGQSSPPHVT